MSDPFQPLYGLILVRAKISGFERDTELRMALDTGATQTVINAAPLAWLGFDTATSRDRVEVTTGSGVEYAPRIVLDRIQALGHERAGFAVLCHTLPPSTNVDGLLGLDFLRGQRLSIDFRSGEIVLS